MVDIELTFNLLSTYCLIFLISSSLPQKSFGTKGGSDIIKLN